MQMDEPNIAIGNNSLPNDLPMSTLIWSDTTKKSSCLEICNMLGDRTPRYS